MENKTIDVLNLLLRREGFVSLKELMVKSGLQERSVRYEISSIKVLVEEQKGLLLLQDRKKGVCLKGNRLDKRAFVQWLEKQETDDYFSNEERVALTALMLLWKQERLTQNRLMEQFQISATTVKKDRRTIEILLQEYQLNLKSDIQNGYFIEGPEQGKRKLLFQLIVQYIDLDDVLFAEVVRYYTKLERELMKYMNKQEICRMKQQMVALYGRLNIKSSDLAFNQMSLMLGIQRKRMDSDFLITEYEPSGYDNWNPPLIGAIRVEFMCNGLSEPEEQYLSDYIMAFTGRSKEDFLQLPNWLEIQLDTIGLVMEMERYTGGDFLTEQLVREALFQHMEVMIHRIKSDIRVYNPLTGMIKEKYGQVYEYCQKAVGFLEKKYQKKFPEEEIAYLTIYFYAYLEQKEPLKVMVVCGQGLSTGHMLAESLKKEFPFYIVGVLAYFEKDTINHIDVDLVVSTIRIESLSIPVIKVSPILTKHDIRVLHEFWENHEGSKYQMGKSEEVLIGSIVKIAKKCSADLDVSRFAEELMKLLYEQKIISRRSLHQYMVKDVLTIDCIQLNQKVDSWQEAIRVSARPLLENGTIEQSYIEAMIQSVEEFGPYIVIADHIALAHARPEEGVNGVGLSIATLEQPIPFGNAMYDPVEMVICLSAVNSFSHLEVLSNIAEIISNKKYVDLLKACNTEEEFLKLVLQAEQEVSIQ